jgi:hypothetical protein
MCKDCSTRTGGECRFHQQSPIHLERSITAKRECKDRHRMGVVEGNCKFGKMDFQVLPHVLRAYQPEYCETESNIDFSWGFPDPWMLKFTDIVVPSHHAQDGKQYAAEVILSHVLSKDMDDKLVSRKAKQARNSVLSSQIEILKTVTFTPAADCQCRHTPRRGDRRRGSLRLFGAVYSKVA